MIFDGHSDIWTHVAVKRRDKGERDIFRKYHLDGFKKADITGCIFIIWIDHEYFDKPRIRCRQIIECMRDEIEDAADILNIVKDAGDFENGLKAGKINVINGFEGLSHIGDEIDLLEEYYENAYMRHASLTWNETNELATGWKGEQNRGLTKTGKQAVRKLEQLGVLLDVSHLNDACFWDVAAIAEKPFVASHSNARAICGHGRNLEDNQIKEIARAGGVIGVNAYSEFVDNNPDRQTVSRLCDHICYISELAGTKHVGFGFDFTYYFEADTFETYERTPVCSTVEGMGYAGEAGEIIAEMRKRGFSKQEIEDICYNNFVNVFKKII